MTKAKTDTIKVDSRNNERMFWEILDAKVSGIYIGLWLLLPELLHFEAWELIKAWCGTHNDSAIDPHLAMQLVNEAALCVTGLRKGRTL